MTPILVVVGLMIAGLVLVAIEVVVLPGFGVIGALGGVALLGAGYVAAVELGTLYGGLALAGGVIGTGVLFWLLPRTRAGKAMVLETAIAGGAADPGLAALLDRQGVTLTALRPAGTVDIDDNPVDVVSDGQYVDPGTRVKVVRVEGSRVVVEPITDPTTNPAAPPATSE